MMKTFLLLLVSLFTLNGFSQTGPSFVNGPAQSFSICENSGSFVIDNYLATQDTAVGAILNYTITKAPSHGTLHGFTATGGSDGSVFTPDGLDYTPSVGYSGTDVFTIQVSDGTNTAQTTFTVSINTLPSVSGITGTTSVCGSGTSTLSDATGGGKWSSSNIFSSTVDSLTGVVTGVSAGAATISYTVTNANGCSSAATTTFIVSGYPTVASIAGTTTVCVNSTTTLTDATSGGVWSSSNINTATISTAGVVTGVAAGTATITYTVTNAYGCSTPVTTTITVNASPTVAAITAAKTTVCVGATITLTDATARGTWTSSKINIATVTSPGGGNAGTATVTGVAAGLDTITYTVTNINGCSGSSSTQVTVGAIPVVGAITGSTTICNGNSSQLADTTAGGTWKSSNTAVATVSATGLVTSVAAGTATITYTVTNSAGCATAVTTTVTVITATAVANIAGANATCVGSTTTLTDATAGGTWSSSNTAIATIDNTGLVTSLALGIDTISYTVSTGGSCTTTKIFVITVGSAITVSTITGSSAICNGTTTALSDATTGGVWTSSDTTVATVGTTGTVTALASGITVIRYTVGSGSCVGSTTHNVLVNATPTVTANSVATVALCSSDSVSLTNSTSGGVWTSSSTATATVTQAGLVTAVAAGTATISYTVTNASGCAKAATTTVTVTTKPNAFTITGTNSTCIGTNNPFTTTGNGGTWATSNAAVASLTTGGPVTLVRGVSAGTASISYTETNGTCSLKDSIVITVAPTLTVSAIQGATNVCVGTNSTYTDSTKNGTWSVTNGTGTATINFVGTLNPTAAGTVTVTYTVNGGCSGTVTKVVTISAVPTVAAIAGAKTVCAGSTITLTDATAGGVWTSNNTNNAVVDSSTGVVTGVRSNGGTTTITYTYTNTGGCSANATYAITVNAGPNIQPSTGVTALCAGSTATFTNTTAGGTWSSDNTAVATVSTTGVVTGVAAGTVTIQYIVPSGNGCASVANSRLTINAVPTVVATTGNTSVCIGKSTQLFNSSTIPNPGTGAWSSSNTAVATVSAAGVVTGVSAGSVNILYTVTNSTSLCTSTVTTTFTVNAIPVVGAIQSPATTVCVGSTLSLTDTTSSGVWGVNDTSLASISTAGVVTGKAAGDVIVTYTVTKNGCISSVYGNGIVEALPTVAAITGTTTLCQGKTTTLASTTLSGVWSSSNSLVASIDASGNVTAVSAGTATISYTVTNAFGCVSSVTTLFTVNALPVVAAITGNSTICLGSATTLGETTSGGTWSSSNTAVATVNSTGLVTSVTIGIDTISYTVINGSGCTTVVTKIITVNATPTASFTINKTSQCLSGNFFVFSNTSSISAGSFTSSWTIDGKTVTTTSPTYAFTTAGKYVVKLVVTSGTGCTDSTTQTVTVNPKPSPAFTINNSSQCLTGNSFVFTNSTTIASGTDTYNWSFGDATGTSTATSPTYSYTKAGTFTVKLTATSNSSCVDSTSQTVTLTTNVTPSISISASATSICSGATVVFTATPTNGGTTPSYQWKKNGVNVGTNASAYSDNTLANGDVIKCVLTSNITCVTAASATSNSITMTVAAYTTPSVSISATATSICPNTSVTFTATPTNGGATPSYQWQKNGVNVGTGLTTYVDVSPINNELVTCILTSSMTCVTTKIATSNSVKITVNTPTTASLTVLNCSNYTWHGTTYTSSGNYTFDTLNTAGCDSLTTLHLTIKQPTTASLTVSNCSSYTWHGTTYTTTGAYTFDTTNAAGCDSLTTLHLTIKQPTTASLTVSNCGSYTWHGTTYNTSGSYTFDTTNAAGCDSLTTLHLTIKQPTTASLTVSNCSSYKWHGTTYTTSGSYTFDTLNTAGCDSLTTLHLTIKQPTAASLTVSNCGSYTWHGTTYTTSGSYTFDTLNTAGCDSLTTLHLTIKQPTTASLTVSNCSSYTWHGTTYTSSGNYTFDTLNTAGCDSLTTLHLTIKQPTTASLTVSNCSSYTWHGTTYTASGNYTFDTLNTAGCDSLTTLHLTIKQPTTASLTVSNCSSYTWHGTTYTSSGNYTFDTLNTAGCDSLTTLHLTIKQPTAASLTVSNCSSYTWHGTTYTASGNYTFDTLNAAGCDSLTTLHLTIKQPTTASLTVSNCSSYTWHGTTYTASGNYTFDTLNAAGCDSLTTLHLTIKQPTTASLTVSNCSSYKWHGTTYTTSGSYTFDTLNAAGCDSLTTLHLTIKQPTTASLTVSNCGSYTWHGTTYTTTGAYTFDTTNAAGCDSLATLHLTIKQPTTASLTVSNCGSYTWHGTTYTTTGAYTFDTTNAAGCDSLTTLHLTIKQPTTASLTVSNCGSYTWHGTTYTASGSYTFDTTNAAGCDSLTTLVLTIKAATTSTTNQSICTSQLPYTWNGTAYTNAGTYTVHLTNNAGCDSVATLVLNVSAICPNTWTGNVSTDWFNAGNWMVAVPSSTVDGIVVKTTNQPVINSSTANVKNITLQSGATLTINSTLNVYGNWTDSGTASVGSGTVILTGASGSLIGYTSFNNLTVEGNYTVGSSTTDKVDIRGILNKVSGTLSTNNKLTLKASSNTTTGLIQESGGSLTGNISMERYVGGVYGYHHLASPVSNATVSNWANYFPVKGTDGADAWVKGLIGTLQVYHEPLNQYPVLDSSYYNYTNPSSPLTPGEGYTAWLTTLPVTVVTYGTPTNGTVNIGVTSTASANAATRGYNFLGNPYPSPISWSALKALNSGKFGDGSCYLWKASGGVNGVWESYNGTVGTNGVGDVIASSQGFFVYVDNSSTITFNNSVRTTNVSVTNYGTTQSREVRLALINPFNPIEVDEIVAYTKANSSDGSSHKMPQPAEATNATLAFQIDGKQLGIDAENYINENTELPLLIRTPIAGLYTLKLSNSNAGLPVYLKDNVTGTYTNIQVSEATLQTTQLQTMGRYSIVFKKPDGATITSHYSIISSSNGILITNTAPVTNTKVMVYNTLGQLVAQATMNGTTVTIPVANKDLAAYVVKIIDEKGTLAKSQLVVNK